MNTAVFIQDCKNVTAGMLALEQPTSGDLDDMEYFDECRDQQLRTVENLIVECENPTLASYLSMVETAINLNLISLEEVNEVARHEVKAVDLNPDLVYQQAWDAAPQTGAQI